MRADLVAIPVHELRERLDLVNDLDPALTQNRHRRDEAVAEDLGGGFAILAGFLLHLLRDLHHAAFHQHRLAVFIVQAQRAHHAGGHQHGDMSFLEAA